MAALDLLGRRWTLRLLWELREGPVGPRAILARCAGLSSSVLYRRIAELDAAGLVERRADGRYALSGMGRELSEAIAPLSRWSERWARAGGQSPHAAVGACAESASDGELSQPD
jgi:DNA-binding HxlR family transcriptional regulator